MKKNLFIICAGLLLASPAARAAEEQVELQAPAIPENVYRDELSAARLKSQEKLMANKERHYGVWSDHVTTWLHEQIADQEINAKYGEAKHLASAAMKAMVTHQFPRRSTTSLMNTAPVEVAYMPVYHADAPKLYARLEERAKFFGIPTPLVITAVNNRGTVGDVYTYAGKHSIVSIDEDCFEGVGTEKHSEMFIDYLLVGIKNGTTSSRAWWRTLSTWVPVVIGFSVGNGIGGKFGLFALLKLLFSGASGLHQRHMISRDIKETLNQNTDSARSLMAYLEKARAYNDQLLGDQEGYESCFWHNETASQKVKGYAYDRAVQARNALAYAFSQVTGRPYHHNDGHRTKEISEGVQQRYMPAGVFSTREARNRGVDIDNHLVDHYAERRNWNYDELLDGLKKHLDTAESGKEEPANYGSAAA